MHRVGVIGGDGIGPEVITFAVSALERAAPGAFEFDLLPYSSAYTAQHGRSLPAGEFARWRSAYDAILFGACGDPAYPGSSFGRDVLLGARTNLDLYANIRPLRSFDHRVSPLKSDENVDLVIVRENTEGAYVDQGAWTDKGTPQEQAHDTILATRSKTERVIRRAFELASSRLRREVCLVSKHNAIRYSHGLWREAFWHIAPEYPDISARELLADAAAMRFVQAPEAFDVVVCENFVGDILSDLGAALIGGLGLAPSANLGDGSLGLFEPVHGSAPDIAGTGHANPLAAILTAAMLAHHVGEHDAARRVSDAVYEVAKSGPKTPDLNGKSSTQAVTGAVLARLG